MPNDFVFDSSVQPVYNQMTNTYRLPAVVAPPPADAAVQARQFTATATNSGSLGLLGGSVTIALRLSNPSGSGRTMYLARVLGGTGVSLSLLSSFSASYSMNKNGTLAAPATVTPVNANFASSATSVLTVQSSTSAAGGGATFLSSPVVAGQFEWIESGGIVVPPNQSLAITLSASLSVAGILSTTLNAQWWEG